jgi:hypothetical protein
MTMYHQSFRFRARNRALSRRQFLGTTAAGAAGLALGSSLLLPGAAHAKTRSAPKPIPGGTTIIIGNETFFIHHYPFVAVDEPSEITDFDGLVADTRVLGSGTGTNTITGDQTRLLFQADMGFMKGVYIGEDGDLHDGTFGFV